MITGNYNKFIRNYKNCRGKSSYRLCNPIGYVICSWDNGFNLFKRAFSNGSKESLVVTRSNNRMGLLVFGYSDSTSIEPITRLLDRVPDFHYATIELADGRKLGFMSHGDARDYLPQPHEGEMFVLDRDAFYEELNEALLAKISADAKEKRPNPRESKEHGRVSRFPDSRLRG